MSDGQRSVPRGKAGNAAAGTEGDTGGGAADSWPQRTAHLWQGAQILHCCRSLPPPPPQRTSEAKKQSFRRSYSQARTKEYHLGWLAPHQETPTTPNAVTFHCADTRHADQLIAWDKLHGDERRSMQITYRAAEKQKQSLYYQV